ncbi:phytoene synthase [Saccharopolyspora rectivirgula]|uniref:Phytoene synthase n=1 Tax=Saccharopolyspora rectivirgula TaxID=28042 RepID=A0A073B7Z2_9PSEU|nr:phytoene synthase [Saccharopolyspora rectivirgula]
MVTEAASIADAYRECERITRQQARNFYYGIRLLQPPKRRALSAVYAFARRVDDVGDGELPAEEKLQQLKQARHALQHMSVDSSDPVLAALADASSRFPIPLPAFAELISGCEADVRGQQYDTFAELVGYCRCVAGSIGRLSLGVFAPEDSKTAEPHADSLGVALQLTNILRDVREDQRNGRVYLPRQDLAVFDVELSPSGELITSGDSWERLIRFQAARAECWYEEGFRLLPMLDRRSRACTAAMAGIYHQLLQRIAAKPHAVIQRRAALPGWRKAVVAVRALAGWQP